MTTLDDNPNQIDLNLPGLGPDTIFAGAGADFVKTSTLGGSLIFGQADNDTLISVGPNDTLYGGADEDSLRSQRTPAWLYGEAGNDIIIAESRATMQGGEGDDFMQGTVEANLMFGNQGNDTMLGGAQRRDTLYGGKGNDSLGFFLTSGSSNLDLPLAGGFGGNEGSNFLRGDLGDDLVVGINVRDSLYGGKGNDTVKGVGSNSYLSGDDGNDRLSVTNTTQNNQFSQSTADTLVTVGIEKVTLLGGLGDDSLTGAIGNFNAGKSFFDGGDGNDTITVFATQDTALGGAGNDFIKSQTSDVLLSTGGRSSFGGFAGQSSLDGGAGNDTIVGGFASDTMIGGLDNDSLSGIFSLGSGGDGNDTINANGTFGTNPTSITLDGGLGNDRLVGNSNPGVTNWMNGGAGNDTIIFGSTGDQLIGDFAGDDIISYANGITFSTTNFITDNLGNNFITGGNGTDVLTTGAGNDLLFGDSSNTSLVFGNDTLDAGAGNDTLLGGYGDDQLFGGDGNDSLGGGPGADTLIGGAGSDSFYYNNFGEGAAIDSLTGFPATTPAGTQPDQIGDFTPGQDKIVLSFQGFNQVLGAAPDSSQIAFDQFLQVNSPYNNTGNPLASSSTPFIFYEINTGRLGFDPDGTGANPGVTLAILDGAPRITASDITLI